MKEKVLIVVHGDIDGIVAGYILRTHHPNARMHFTQPFNLGWVITSAPQYKEIYVADLPINVRTPQVTVALLEHPAVKEWYDHHVGWETVKLTDGARAKLRVDVTAPSAASLIPNAPAELVSLANAADADDLDDPVVRFLTRALHANPRDHTTKYDIMSYMRLRQRVARYVEIEQHTDAAVQAGVQHGDLFVVDLTTHNNGTVDRTKIFFDGYQVAPYVAIISTYQGRRGITVGTRKKEVDLATILGKASNIPYRITIPYRDDYVAYLTAMLP